MGAKERAALDRARGDLGSARRRLASLLDSSGYDAQACHELAALCLEMGDPVQAGRWLYICERDEGPTEPDAHAALAAFTADCRDDPVVMASRLPRFIKTAPPGALPGSVQARLEPLGLPRSSALNASGGKRSSGWAMGIGCVIVLVVVAACAVIGFGVIVRAIIGGLAGDA